jgi:crossover junction endodeoxyribonuclease RuvC
MSNSPKDSKPNDPVAVARTEAPPGCRRIIGLDPGLASSGWGLIDFDGRHVRYLAYGCIETKADRPLAERLFFICDRIRLVLHTYKPTEAAIETLYFSRNVSSAIPVAQARGVLCMAMAEQGIPVYEFTPNIIKQAVAGRGSANKAEVQAMVRLLLSLDAIPKPDHAADALAAAITSARQFFHPSPSPPAPSPLVYSP